MHWVYLIAAIISEVIGTSALTASEGFTRLWPSVAVVIAYGIAFYFLALTLRTLPVGVTYAVWSGVGTVLIALVGALWFQQSLDLAAVFGIGLIIAGVVVLNVFSTSVSH